MADSQTEMVFMFDDWRAGASSIGRALAAIVLCEAVGLLAAWGTRTSVATWYPTLDKPGFTPPNWVFAPTWIVLYALMGVAAFLVWRRGPDRIPVRRALVGFAIQLALNGGWSFAFFGARSPALGLTVILFLWVAVAWTMSQFFRIRSLAGWLLVPYLGWITYAAALNAAIWGMN